ncbi:MAG: prepilin-type N-terminal cleavage/methylation domain-containing protein, partial [Kiritimatiellae bacterium]|nr:prepilin-type N-terminal cleavage/methylation domain-containing protein [Kiritimatiellia bacterium]
MLKKGFTLVELLIVIVVIAILTSITFRIMGVS